MKKLFVIISLVFAGLCFATEVEQSSPTLRILTLTGAPHPKAEVQSIDVKTGTLIFRFLDAKGKPVDSGFSVVRFTPVEPDAKAKPTDPETYADAKDADLAAAIAAANK